MLKSVVHDSYQGLYSYCPLASTQSFINHHFNSSVHYLCNFKFLLLNFHLCFQQKKIVLGKTVFNHRQHDYLCKNKFYGATNVTRINT